MSGLQIFALAITVLGGWVFIHPFMVKRKINRSREWPETEAEIIRSEVKKTPGKNRTYRPRIEYNYTVGGKKYKSKKIVIGGKVTSSSKRKARDVCDQYPVGSMQTIFYNPDKPSEAYLERRQEGIILNIVIGAFFFLLGIGILTGVFSALGF